MSGKWRERGSEGRGGSLSLSLPPLPSLASRTARRRSRRTPLSPRASIRKLRKTRRSTSERSPLSRARSLGFFCFFPPFLPRTTPTPSLYPVLFVLLFRLEYVRLLTTSLFVPYRSFPLWSLRSVPFADALRGGLRGSEAAELEAAQCACSRRRGEPAKDLPRALVLQPSETQSDIGRDIFSTLKLLRLEVELRPPTTAPSVPRIKRRRSLLTEHPRRRRPRHSHRQGALLPASRRDSKIPIPVLQECVSHENVPALGFVAAATIEPIEKYQINQHKSDLTALHLACASSSEFWDVERLCASGCEVNHPNFYGKTPLHVLLTGELVQKGGGSISSWRGLLNAVKEVVKAGAELGARDSLGETPLLSGLRRLVGAGEYERAAELGYLLIEAGSDPDATNDDGRSALTYSVHHLDDSVVLTRLLLNCGASVWSGGGGAGTSEGGALERSACGSEEVAGAISITSPLDRDQSAFTWFLRAVIRRRRVEHCSETLALLSQVMGECPRRMHSHVLRTMFRHVKCYKILGPVFYQLKLSMMRYWTQPHDLRYLCWRALRKSLRPGGHLVSGAAKLGLPKPVQQYLLMET